MMSPEQWKVLLETLADSSNTKAAVKAAKSISKAADASHVSALYDLLKSDDFFVREAVAIPLARLEGAASLPFLFDALERGEAQSHDNDSLTNTIIGTLEKNKKEAAVLLTEMASSKNIASRANAVWAMGFIIKSIDAKILFDLFSTDPDAEVQQLAGDALQILDPAKGKNNMDTHILTGRWMWLDCAPHLSYGLEITGIIGTCLKTNSPCFAIGDTILKVHRTSGNAFVGQQIFTNGAWYPVTGKVEDNKLLLQGAGLNWIMEKVD